MHAHAQSCNDKSINLDKKGYIDNKTVHVSLLLSKVQFYVENYNYLISAQIFLVSFFFLTSPSSMKMSTKKKNTLRRDLIKRKNIIKL